jgi:hypothetical protein
MLPQFDVGQCGCSFCWNLELAERGQADLGTAEQVD